MKNFKEYFDSIPHLETERFVLGPFSTEDMDDYFAVLRDNRVQKYLGGGLIGLIDLGGFVRKTMAEIACHYAYDSWGRGAATEAAACVTAFGLEELGLKRIQGARPG